MIIDFTNKKELMNESWLRQFGAWNKLLLKSMYGKDVKMMAPLTSISDIVKMIREEDDSQETINFVVRGEQRDVKAYADALYAEKNYLDRYLEHGDSHPQTAKAREVLRQAVTKFETQTGITWPFSDEG